MKSEHKTVVSPVRLRVGIILLFLFWIPFWALVPVLESTLNITSSQGIRNLTIVVMLLQSALGLAGVVIAGKQVALVMKSTKRKQMPKKVWHIVWTGKID